jgi:cytochrome c-type biogenesis protein CcmF
LQSRQITVGQPYFARLGAPIGIALLFLMAIGPALPWRAASGTLLRDRLLIPAWVGAATLVIAVVAGARGIANVLAFSLAAFTLASIIRSVVVGVRARRRTSDDGLARAAVHTVRGNPRLYGGLIVHTGVVIVAVGLATTGGWTTRRELQLSPGQSGSVRGHTVTYIAREVEQSSQKTTIKARVHIDGIGSFAPAISTYPNSSDGIGTPSIHTGPLHDWYVTLVSSPSEGQVSIGVQVGTLVLWLWIGGFIMAIGTAVALVPVRRRRVLEREVAAAPHDDEAPSLVEVSS